MTWKQVEPDVFYTASSPVSATADDLRMIENHARNSSRGRARLCAHPDAQDGLHEMLICLMRHCYVRPHRHSKVESALILSGECDLVLFDEQGKVVDLRSLGPFGSGRPFFVRLGQPTFHTYLIRTESLLFLETTPGPFDRNQTEYAEWAPDEKGSVDRFLQDLERRVAKWRSAQATEGT